MLGVLARAFNSATRTETRQYWGAPSHWAPGERFDNRRNAEIEAHLAGRRV